MYITMDTISQSNLFYLLFEHIVLYDPCHTFIVKKFCKSTIMVDLFDWRLEAK